MACRESAGGITRPECAAVALSEYRVLADGTRRISLGHMPHSMRIAIGMSLHEADERRAMEGEMQPMAG